ncbi:OmpA family protein [Vibrio parahaemolyticus]|uniref:OmpA family protein n=1 Tax=Vibrio parahaemolyticus TaxID=670 RepID=A0AAW8PX18_VIBPH|nr:OmpA family protein [Vibrio parahaemolyticus]EGR2229384.1 OmpA family protein [Vibrio parahaemolyticus]MDS1820782.1 OmpA family protein [Vibrio parahaemolyticus]
MNNKKLIGALVATIILSGCSATQDTYKEKSSDTAFNEPVTMETLFADETVVYTEADIEEEKNSILGENHGYYSTDEFLYELGEKGVDLSVIETGTVNFGFDSSKLTEESKTLIEKHVKLLKESEKLKVILEGHTDSTGDRSYNLKLGERRALAVKDFAVSLGAKEHQIEVISYGEEKLMNKEQNEDEKRLNRRAEFVYK